MQHTDERRNDHAKWSLSDSETPRSYVVTYTWNLKKGYNELICRTERDSQTLRNLWLPKETGWGNELGVRDENVLKLGCDDGCIAIDIIKFTELKKK